MFCSQCGAQVNEGMKFCPACGAPVKKSTPPPKLAMEVGELLDLCHHPLVLILALIQAVGTVMVLKNSVSLLFDGPEMETLSIIATLLMTVATVLTTVGLGFVVGGGYARSPYYASRGCGIAGWGLSLFGLSYILFLVQTVLEFKGGVILAIGMLGKSMAPEFLESSIFFCMIWGIIVVLAIPIICLEFNNMLEKMNYNLRVLCQPGMPYNTVRVGVRSTAVFAFVISGILVLYLLSDKSLGFIESLMTFLFGDEIQYIPIVLTVLMLLLGIVAVLFYQKTRDISYRPGTTPGEPTE